MKGVAVVPVSDHSRYSLHPEEDVVEIPPHRHQVVYLETNLRALLPDRYVGANMGVYWIPGEYEEPWAGPDVLVSRHRPAPPPQRIYLTWEHGPLSFVAEVASERTRRQEQKKREQTYRVDLQVPEYLYIDVDRRQLQLWRLREGEYHRVTPEDERLYSRELDLWFAWDAHDTFVRIWTADGRMLLTKEEDLQALEAAEQRAREAEARAADLVRAAEARAAALEAEVERLRRAGGGDTESSDSRS
jgi:Uma2 family endonuclease